MRIVIFANGILEDPASEIACWIRPDDLLVAANGGTQHALDAGLTLDHVIGDLDSLSSETIETLNEAGTRIHDHPPAKDETDLELALLWAADQEPAADIVVLAALGGRPDQALANLLLLALPELDGHDVRMVGSDWEIRLIRSSETLALRGQPGETISLVPLGGDAHGVTTAGLRYALDGEVLRFGPARGISNVLERPEAEITLDDGLLWCFHKRNREA